MVKIYVLCVTVASASLSFCMNDGGGGHAPADGQELVLSPDMQEKFEKLSEKYSRFEDLEAQLVAKKAAVEAVQGMADEKRKKVLRCIDGNIGTVREVYKKIESGVKLMYNSARYDKVVEQGRVVGVCPDDGLKQLMEQNDFAKLYPSFENNILKCENHVQGILDSVQKAIDKTAAENAAAGTDEAKN